MTTVFKNIIKKTPLELCNRLSNRYNCNVYLKREDLQIVRSFKIRGAYHKISKYYERGMLNEQEFVTASAGNHAQGVAHICNIHILCNEFN
jgi:threonine dehydratase